jgi:hypothetical protein
VIGFLGAISPERHKVDLTRFHEALKEAGFSENSNAAVRIDGQKGTMIDSRNLLPT